MSFYPAYLFNKVSNNYWPNIIIFGKKLMTKILPICIFFFGITTAQNYYGLDENFENEINEKRWSVLDRDGDGKTWQLTPSQNWTTALGFSGSVYVSDSYDKSASQPLNPDNVLVSPAFIYETPRIKNTNALLGISFRISASDPVKFSETYALYILPATQTFTGTETPIFFETLNSGATSKKVFVEYWNWENMGYPVKLYFRHYNSQNQNALIIDDIVNYNYTMSVNDMVYKNKNIISPNPAKRFIKIDLKNKPVQSIEIIDAAGRTYNPKLNSNEVNVEALKPGIYYIKVKTENTSYINKFIKE